ncbi:MAG: hypothetical protein IPP40_12035 [bacterium]|nr:hypothetical protein [bacterium]
MTPTVPTFGPNLQWCNAPRQQSGVRLASDGVGGAIAVWSDRRNSPDIAVYSQRLTAGGSAMWQENGIRKQRLTSHPSALELPQV